MRKNDREKLRLRQTCLVICDVMLFAISSFAALLLRHELEFSSEALKDHLDNVVKLFPLTATVTVVCFALFGLYRSLWRFAGEREIVAIPVACIIATFAQTALQFLFNMPVPRSFPFINFLVFTLVVFMLRMSYRLARHILDSKRHRGRESKRTMIVGAGEAGAMILRDLKRSRQSTSNVICLVDDDETKIGKIMYGVKVAGSTYEIEELADRYKIDDIIFAIPTASAVQKRRILGECQKTVCSLKTLPGMYQLVNGEVNLQKIRRVEIDDLLARDSIKVNIDEIVGYVNGKIVLVTGGGGSIGSELCRQIASHGPKKLIIFDIYENNAYSIEQELRRKNPYLDLLVLIGSVRDKDRVEQVFSQYRPDIVYHAAAHKHVPLMEDSPCESIKNNVFGTVNVAEAADHYGTETFVLISTDKAVNPTNIMGASKRLCEMIIKDMDSRSATRYACVRFGNVLGSNGSVIPLFKQQIENGGPVTVTHKDVIRYFMTIPEAVSLVLQAGSYTKGGEVFVLDMGEPVKIDDLARKMIRLSGFEPDVDIPVEYTGLRPGEKLYEELLMSEEGLEKTKNEMIFIGKLEEIDSSAFRASLAELKRASDENSGNIRMMVKALVPTYDPR